MKKFSYLLLFLLIGCFSFAQVSTLPNPAEANAPITLVFDKTGTAMASYSGTIYAHIGLTVNDNQWQYVIGDWGNNSNQPALTHVSGNIYHLVLSPDLFTYFGVPTTSTITQICVVFRAAAGSPQTQDYFISVGAFQMNLTSPAPNSVTLLESGSNFSIAANNTGGNASYTLKSNGVVIHTNTNTSNYSYTHNNITQNQNYELDVTQNGNTITKTFSVVTNPGLSIEAMPEGLEDGINYDDTNTGAYLVLDAPFKDFVYVAGSFNNWQPDGSYLMKKDPDTGKFWIHLSGLEPQEVYTYQYWVCDMTDVPANAPKIVKTADPYSTLVLSPFDDPWIPASSYPNMPAYPEGQEREVTVLQTGQPEYEWQVNDFQKPDKEKLVIYEVLIRDFDANRNFQDLIDRIDYFKSLHVNAIQLMPVMEYEGNESWGYNTVFHMALDKYYGTPDKLKEFVDLCHENGIAVILDLAINHAFGRNPLVRMWMNDPENDGWGEPNAENPYFNQQAMHSYNVGNDFNHQSNYTKYYTKRVIKHWIEEYRIDGIRWDLTKGFTQNCPYTGNSAAQENCTNSYQADRVAVLKEYADYSWSIDPDHYVIFEHLGPDNEEKEWADYRFDEGKGIMLWGIMTEPYNQLTMGYASNPSSNFNRMGHVSRGFEGARLIGYAESHDEERLMYKNLQYGNSSNASHNVKNLNVALSRMSALGAVSLTIPGPKMIWHFGELGMENSIFTCENGTVNPPGGTDGDCKLATKPQPQWENNWLANAQRYKIYADWSKIINMKVNNEVFSGSYTINSGTLKPRIYIWNDDMPDSELKNVVILANFEVTTQQIVPDFPYTGVWYNLMNNETINVTNTAAPITLQPGEFRIFGNQQAVLSSDSFVTTEELKMYPNPVTDYIAFNQDTKEVVVYNFSGQIVKRFEGREAYNLMYVGDLSRGVYIIKANNKQNLKLIKQ